MLQICVFQEWASLENDTERSQECQSQLEELEERAKELDQRRTYNISAIRSALQSAWLCHWSLVAVFTVMNVIICRSNY